MEAFKNCLLIIPLSVFLTGQGCRTLPPSVKPVVSQADTAWREPTWGEAAEGLQCRLRPDRRIWMACERPSFKADIRNQGRRIFAFLPFHQLELCRIQFDDKWHPWPSPFMIDSPVWPLSPGAQFNDISITLHERFKINLTPGRHIVRVVFSLEGIDFVSNPVGIEILPPG
jgi:hypothetical protein